MTGSRDLQGDMRNLILDRGTADRLLSGKMLPDDAPPAYAQVAETLRAATWLGPVDPEREPSTVSVMAERIASQPVPRPSHARVSRRPNRARVMALVVAGTLIGTTGLAFAGALPAPAQNVAHTLFAHVGVTIPDPEGDAGATDSSTEQPSRSPSTPQSAAPEPHGQAGEPHGQAGEPHGQAGQPHGQAGQPHGQAGQPHGKTRQTGGTS